MNDFNDWVIQPSDQRINLKDAIDPILDFNEDQLDLVWAPFENIKIKKWVNDFNMGETLKNY